MSAEDRVRTYRIVALCLALSTAFAAASVLKGLAAAL
ncbi:hypothetical protein ACVWW6_005557 [Bradyrhizobium sp. USDA 3311]